MKRIIAWLMTLVLLLGCAAAGETAEPEKPNHKIEKMYPLYLISTEIKSDNDFPLYFVDGADDLPFVNLGDWCEILDSIFADAEDVKGYKLTATAAKMAPEIASIQRENGSTMTCNFEDGEIVFTDFHAF